MDFSYLLEIAKQNSDQAGKQASVKRYSTDLKPPKRESKGNVKSGAIKAFLARKEEEERQKEIENQQKRSELLSLRAQNTKNSKKAKLMVSRTKDNDYSKIKLTEEEEQMRKQREIELQRRMLTDKIERMKARIELEEKEKLLPRKRKRKTRVKSDDSTNEKSTPLKEDEKTLSDDAELIPNPPHVIEQKRKAPPPAQPSMNFHDLLKLASKKQHEPIPTPKVVKEVRPMTEKEKRLYEEQQLRKKGISVYSLPQVKTAKKTKANSENNFNKKQVNSGSADGKTDPKLHVKRTSGINSSGKNTTTCDQDLIQKEYSQCLNNKTTFGHTSKLKKNFSTKHSRYDEEDDEEDDDDLADFIDDGPVDNNYDFSSQIREIFKYDSNRYNDEEDDDDVMESSFCEQMKEECRSAKIGLMEDLEDMRKEEEERKRKLMKQKKKGTR